MISNLQLWLTAVGLAVILTAIFYLIVQYIVHRNRNYIIELKNEKELEGMWK